MGLAVVFFLFSLGLTVLTWNRVKWWTDDSFQYLRLADNLWHGHGHVALEGFPNFFFPPVYSLVVGFLDKIVQNAVISGRVVSAIGSAFSIVAFYLVARRWFSRSIVVLAAALYLASPLRIWSSSWVMTEGLYSGLIWGAILAAFAGTNGFSVAVGLLCGLAYLTRPEGILYVFVVVAIQVLQALPHPRRGMQRAGLTVFAFGVVAFLYLLYVHNQTGRWMFAGKLEFNLAWAYAQDRGVPLAELMRFDPNTLQVTLPDYTMTVMDLARRYVRNVRFEIDRLGYLLGPSQVTIALLLFGLASGLAWARQKSHRAHRWVSLMEQGLLVLPLAALPVLFISDRFLISSVPILCLWLSLGFFEVGTWMAERYDMSWWNRVVPLTLFVLFGLAYTFRVVSVHPETLEVQQRIGAMIQAEVQRSQGGRVRVMTPDSAIVYFAGQEWINVPNANADELLRFACKTQAKYLVIRETDRAIPAAAELFGSSASPAGLTRFALTGAAPSIRLYRVDQTCPPNSG